MEKKRIAIIACRNIKGISCVGGCLKCFKGIAEKAGEYERWKDYEIEVIGMDDCGGCPGVIMPKSRPYGGYGEIVRQGFRRGPSGHLCNEGHSDSELPDRY